jgi:hypothetical protein
MTSVDDLDLSDEEESDDSTAALARQLTAAETQPPAEDDSASWGKKRKARADGSLDKRPLKKPPGAYHFTYPR